MKKLGPPSFGFIRDGGMLRPHPQEAGVRRYLFELFAEHQRKKTVAVILNAEGHRTRGGAEFNGTTIGRLLAEEVAKGIPDVAAPLVSEELWNRCNDILNNQKANGPAKRKVAHLFAGLIHCRCGSKMYVPSNTDKYVCSGCRSKIPSDDLEAIFIRKLSDWVVSNDIPTSQNVNAVWSKSSFDVRRQVVEQIAERIVIDGKKVTFGLVVM